jgi:hypothetical protein
VQKLSEAVKEFTEKSKNHPEKCKCGWCKLRNILEDETHDTKNT